MERLSYGDRGPIAALATPLAESALAIIRTSGGGTGEGVQSAIELAARVFSRPEKLLSAPPNSVVHGWIVDDVATNEHPAERSGSAAVAPNAAKNKIDEVLVSVYRAPHSYTGEDAVDISCHGGIAAVKAVMAALKKAGFRDALPGEFTFRAFMNGKLDLTRAESVMELVSAKTGRGREQAVRRLAGVLEKEIAAIKGMLVEVLAGTEIYLDYSEDEFTGAQNDEEMGLLPERHLAELAAARLRALAELWRRERLYADGALAVLAGRPNAGKSSLFNYLLREDRSIVTDIPGTTRDWIEALISLDDIPLRLVDTAGLRTADQNNDEAERIGIRRSFELLDRADIVLYVVDGLEGITKEDREFLLNRKNTESAKPLIILWNKADLAPPPAPLSAAPPVPPAGNGIDSPTAGNDDLPYQLLPVSAKTGEGIAALTGMMSDLLEAASTPLDTAPADVSSTGTRPATGSRTEHAAATDSASPGTLRQKELIDSALASTEEALALADSEEPLDIIAPLFRSAVNSLGEITGEVYNDDILEVMFSRFCVGK